MTDTDFLKIPAGRKLDRLVAQEVMGWTNVNDEEFSCLEFHGKYGHRGYGMGRPPESDERFFMLSRGGCRHAIPYYSEWIEEAWAILEKLYEEKEHAKVKRIFKWKHFEDGLACHYPRGPWGVQFGESCQFAFGDTAPVAICRAAILHVRKLDWPVYPGGKKETS